MSQKPMLAGTESNFAAAIPAYEESPPQQMQAQMMRQHEETPLAIAPMQEMNQMEIQFNTPAHQAAILLE